MPKPKFSMPRPMTIYAFDRRDQPIEVPAGAEVLVSLTIVRGDGTEEVVLQEPLMHLDNYANAPLVAWECIEDRIAVGNREGTP